MYLCKTYYYSILDTKQDLFGKVGRSWRITKEMCNWNRTSEISYGNNKKITKSVSIFYCMNYIITFYLFNLTFITLLFRLHASDTRRTLDKDMNRREQQLHEIEQTLPKPNGTYLSIILGSVNVSILNKNDK